MAAELILVDAATVRPVREAAGLAVRRDGDDDPRAAHFAVKQGKRVLGVASIVPDPRDDRRERWRLVGLTADAEAEGDVGGMLVRAVRAIAANRGGGLWCRPADAVGLDLGPRGFDADGEVLVARPDDTSPGDDED